uniref:Serpentine Receptor, class T n=1 Tax=Rhabditophanes sp. KR3021 TaxID=114890 RepID=A0AC35UFA5_9BILA
MYNNTLWNFIFNDFRYNCSVFSQSEIYNESAKSFYLGFFELVLSTTYIIIYLPFIIAMAHPNHIKLPVYKLLFFLGIIDMVNLLISGTVTGIYTLNGTHYCQFPTITFVLGCIALGIWIATDLAVTLLLISRIMDALYPDVAEIFFKGYRTLLWIFSIFVVLIYTTFFSPPVIFIPTYYSWFFNPYISSKYVTDIGNIYHTINNFFIFGSQFTLYIMIVFVFFSSGSGHSSSAKKLAIRLFIQCAFICFLTLTTSGLYLCMMFLDIQPWVSMLGNTFWMSVHGFSGIIFLALNNSLKNTIKSWFGKKKVNQITNLNSTNSKAKPITTVQPK